MMSEEDYANLEKRLIEQHFENEKKKQMDHS